VSDRSLLSSAKDFIEIVAPNDLQYSMDSKTVGASGENRGVVVQYKDIEIRADDVQVHVPLYEIRAKNAILRIGKEERVWPTLLPVQPAHGLRYYELPLSTRGYPADGSGDPIRRSRKSTWRLPSSTWLVRRPMGKSPSLFNFIDLSDSTTDQREEGDCLSAKVHSRRPTFMSVARIMRLPLFKVSLFGQTRSSPTRCSRSTQSGRGRHPWPPLAQARANRLLRLNMGQNAGRNIVGNRGIFVNYEYCEQGR
jgi:hypothetical protein